ALFDAIGTYLGGAMDVAGQKVLVIYTDGGDTRSAMTYADLISTLKACDVTVYAIGFLENQSHASRTEQRLHLQQMAHVTRGPAGRRGARSRSRRPKKPTTGSSPSSRAATSSATSRPIRAPTGRGVRSRCASAGPTSRASGFASARATTRRTEPTPRRPRASS